MSEVCRAIVEASRRYSLSIEGLAWDNVLDAAPLLQAYVVGRGERRSEIVTGLDSDKQAARLLWSMLSVWGHVWDPLCRQQTRQDSSVCEHDIMCVWIRRGTRLISTLRGELRPILQKLAELPETPRPEDVESVRDDLSLIHGKLMTLGRELGLHYGGVAAAKTIAILTLFHLPPVDTSIAENLARCKMSTTNATQCYLNTVRGLARLLQVCLDDPVFSSYIAERRTYARSVVRAKPFKVLDEGLWFIAQYQRDEGTRKQIYEEARRLAGFA